MNSLYYTLKPLIPRDLQITLRRIWAQRKLRVLPPNWFISETSAKPPPGWQGWPDGKKFALVLTHDVEGPEGLRKVRDLAQMEMDLGFRSSFNFVAKKYAVPPDLLQFLQANGFEVGVHGLYHDGKLYSSRRVFKQRAIEINRYLQQWQSVGFRSPAMQYRKDWLHALGIEYDGSTFDCDPFEIQSSQVGTIFPFRVGANSSGYLELPCTFPQDFTLFVILNHRDISAWRQKLDWIAAKGGMALVLTHPDYMNFDPAPANNHQQYPHQFYQDFLHYIRINYDGQYWLALPKDVADFWPRQEPLPAPPSSRRPLKVAMVSYSFYDFDNRVTRYAETLQEQGHQVDVISLRKPRMSPVETINGIHVYRIQERTRDEQGKYDYLLRILKFLLKAAIFLAAKDRKQHYDLVHVHSVPDFMVLSALAPKLRGAKIILDIHDILPEFYSSKFAGAEKGCVFKLMRLVEKGSAAFADHVIIANDLWRRVLIERSVAADKCTTILNFPNEKLFFPRRHVQHNGKFVICYPGTVNWHQGLDVAIQAMAALQQRLPNVQLHIYGEGDSKDLLLDLIAQLKLQDKVFLKDPVPFHEVAAIMADSDLGIVPKRRNSFGNTAFSTKILEFMAIGVPVLVADTDIDRYYFCDSNVKFFQSGNVEDLACSMCLLAENRALREAIAANALEFVRDFSWARRQHEYLSIVDSLVGV